MKKIRCIIMTTMCVLVAWFWTSCTKDEVELTGEIYGKITNGQSGEPLNGVSVTITPGGKSTFTGNDGAFSFVGCEPGQYSLQAQKTGFQTNYKQISVVAGETAVGDMALSPAVAMVGMVVAPSELVFGSSMDVLTFTIHNNGNAGDVAWNLSGVDAGWLTVSPVSGVTGEGGTSVVSVFVDRSGLTETESAIITVNMLGGSQAVRVTVTPE